MTTYFPEGLTVREMGTILHDFGAYNAFTLDGGGSSQLAFADPVARRVNGSRGFDRPVGNNLAIFVVPEPASALVLVGTGLLTLRRGRGRA